MFHPVGHQSPSVYWRRRLLLAATAAALLALIFVTGHVLLGKDSKSPAAGGSSPGSGTSHSSTSVNQTSTQHSSSSAAGSSSGGSSSSGVSTSPGGSGSSSVVALPCTPAQLVVSAVTDKTVYSVGSQPVLMLQVLDKATVPCIEDLADSQIVLRVYNGVSRVWGSHDCQVQPGKDLHTLAAGQPVRISIVWSGLSSQPNCAGTRQRVGAGTYTLYVSLNGRDGTSAQFAMK